MSAVASCRGLEKSFGPTRALDGLDLELERGQVHGFLGPNGAGKSVTMRILLGLLRHDGGEVELFGRDPWRSAVDLHRRLAYVPGDTNLWPNLTGGEIIDLMGDLRGHIDPARREELIERFELDPTKKARSYSKGNRQKVALVAALASDAELLILDEPTSGLDPLKEAIFQDYVVDARDEGRTVLLSSHVLAEVDKLCDHITIIRQGRTVQSGRLDDLRHLTRSTITAEVSGPVDDLAGQPGVHDLESDGDRVHFGVDGRHLPAVLITLADLGVTSLVSHPPTLEELFLHHYDEEQARDGLPVEAGDGDGDGEPVP
ncbi:MAG: ABC transporter ATP-binding protein [Acidimicrobiales bacterium]|nr:ABC transporter ATP-binding protein [Acidimicrobiales bacterium]